MATIAFQSPVTTQEHLNAAIAVFKQLRSGEKIKELTFEASCEMKEIDLHLIAYLVLFKSEYKDLTIGFELPFNHLNSPNSDLGYKLCQYGTYAYLMTGLSIFDIRFGQELIYFDFSKATDFHRKNFFVLSNFFVLLLFVKKDDNEQFDLLFETPLMQLTGEVLRKPEAQLWDIKTKLLYRNVSNFLINTAVPKDRPGCIKTLGRLAFYKSLNAMRVLSIYLDADFRRDPLNKRQELHAGEFSSGAFDGKGYPYHQYVYYDKLGPLIRTMEQHSLVHQFVFATLVSSGMFRQTNIEESVQLLERLWSFTIELVYGLRELAKNLREHSSRNEGIIAMRIYGTERYQAMQILEESQKSFFEAYLEDLASKSDEVPPAFLNIHVLDTGTTGMIPTLMNSSKTIYDRLSAKSTARRLLLEDIDRLRGVDFTIANLLAPSKEQVLNQQVKRSIAHLGLMLFYNLILRNNGQVILSSLNPAGGRDTVSLPDVIGTSLPTAPLGTHFHILLPVLPKRSLETHLPELINLPGEASSQDIRGLEELFVFEAITSSETLPDNPQKLLYTVKLSAGQLKDRVDELRYWEEIVEEKQKLDNVKADVIYNLDLDDVELDGSQLFRLLGSWQAAFPKTSLIISNIRTSRFEELVNINADFADKRGNHYWNAVSAVLVYHYEEIRSDRFYFVDALWGSDREEYRQLNRMIARNNINYTSIFLQQKKRAAKTSTRRIQPLNLAFYNKGALLPLDILLKTGELTFFESNALVLLKNEIKPKITTGSHE